MIVTYPHGTVNAFQPVKLTRRGEPFTNAAGVQFAVPPENRPAATWLPGATESGDLGFWVPSGLTKGRYDVIARPVAGAEDTQLRIGTIIIN